jgi:hypothetical protein
MTVLTHKTPSDDIKTTFNTPSTKVRRELDTEPQQLDTEPQQLDTEPQQLDIEPQQIDTEPQQLNTEPQQKHHFHIISPCQYFGIY